LNFLDSKVLFDDADLALQLKNGDINAFESIFNKYKTKLFFFAFNYLHSAPEAEEIIQNTFLTLWEHRQSINESLSLKNLLYKITVNDVYNRLKHESVRRKYLDYANLHATEEDECTENSVNFKDLKQTVDMLIDRLPDQQKTIYKMSRRLGMSHNEIAQKLEISVRSVESHVYRALKYIKTNLDSK
jgi:RNA polymerase sigma-70 factor, ECF subfamily